MFGIDAGPLGFFSLPAIVKRQEIVGKRSHLGSYFLNHLFGGGSASRCRSRIVPVTTFVRGAAKS